MSQGLRWVATLGVGVALSAGCVPTSAEPQPPCGSPPPAGYCCSILWGSLHGTITDSRGQPQSGVQVTLKTQTGQVLGNCSQQLTVVTGDDGKYAFDVVPFGVPVDVTASSKNLGTKTASTTVVRGPLVYLDLSY